MRLTDRVCRHDLLGEPAWHRRLSLEQAIDDPDNPNRAAEKGSRRNRSRKFAYN
jgi:hypothetical protein